MYDPPEPSGRPDPASLGGPASPGDPTSPGDPASTSPARRGRGTRVLAAVLVAALSPVAAGAMLLAARDDPAFPDRWDPRIADLAAFVAAERDLPFEHPVYVDFLTDDAFVERIRGLSADAADPALAAQAATFTAMVRAIGLIEGDVDLLAQSQALDEVSILAYYSWETHRITVRGTALDVATRVTVVHELTHALQDQHFDLQAIQDTAAERDTASPTPLIEGDASRVEQAYAAELDDDETEEYQAGRDEQVDDEAFAEIPLLLQLQSATPYVFGPAFVTLLHNLDGNAAVDEAFAAPPESEAMYLDPIRYLDGDTVAAVGTFRAVADGEEILDEGGAFGALSWYFMLGEQLDAVEALDAALGWGGDAYRVIGRGDDTCTQLRFVGDTNDDTDEMRRALDRWRAALPHSELVEVRSVGARVDVEACDPGTEVEGITTGDAETAFTIAAFRLGMLGGLVGEGATIELAMCVTDGVLAVVPTDEVVDGSFFEAEGWQDELFEIGGDCRRSERDGG